MSLPNRELPWSVIGAVLVLALAGAALYVVSGLPAPGAAPSVPADEVADAESYEAFGSAEDFRGWLARAGEPVSGTETAAPQAGLSFADGRDGSVPGNFATDGQFLYYAHEQRSEGWTGILPVGTGTKPLSARSGGIEIARVSPAAAVGHLDRSGDLLLVGETLLVFSSDGVYAYDVSDPAAPAERWSALYRPGHSLVTARLIGGDLFLATRAAVDRAAPCPIVPLSRGDDGIAVSCGNVWHPAAPSPVDAVISVVAFSPATGEALRSAAVVADGALASVYISPANVYVTAYRPAEPLAVLVDFLAASPGLVPQETVARLVRVLGYDLGAAARLAETQAVLEEWRGALPEADRERLTSALTDRLAALAALRRRDLGKTVVARLPASNLDVEAVGVLSGRLLGSAALDEREGYLRAAVTVGGPVRFADPVGTVGDGGVSDVTVLDESLRPVASFEDLGEGAAATAALFLADRGYVAAGGLLTVIDLADPRTPPRHGPLPSVAAPAFLDDLGASRLLVVSRDGSQTRVTVLDVSLVSAPRELARYALSEYWADVIGTRQAFLLDVGPEAFFLPASKGGLVFSYAGNTLAVAKFVTGVALARAVTFGDTWGLIGEGGVTFLDAQSWRTTGQVEWGR